MHEKVIDFYELTYALKNKLVVGGGGRRVIKVEK